MKKMQSMFVLFGFFPSSPTLFMNVRFDTWMKRANLCAREPLSLSSLKLAVTQVHMVHIYYPDGSMAKPREQLQSAQKKGV